MMFLHVMLVGGKLPTRGYDPEKQCVSDPDAVGYDLYAPAAGFVDPLSRKLIKLGIKTAFTPGYVGKIFDRSGMGNKGLASFAGVIDPSYRGEWGVILYNSTPHRFEFQAGHRLAQVLFFKVELPEVLEVSALDETGRGAGAYGSTGK